MSVERKLIVALQNKDNEKLRKVFEEIYYSYYDLVCFCIYQYVKNNSDIEELANDVFINFYNHIETIKIDNIKYYLTTSAKNISLNFIRKNKNYKVISLDENIKSFSEESYNDDIYDELSNILDKESLYILYEHIVNDVKLKDLSIKLNISYPNMKKRYQRIVLKTRKEYKRNGK